MFSRIHNAIRIIAYREPHDGADAVIVAREDARVSRTGRIIGHVLEIFIAAYTIGYVAGVAGERLSKFLPRTHAVSNNTLIGALGVLIVFIIHSIRTDIEASIRKHIDLGEALAPYFGHRLSNALRILRGSMRAS